MRQFIRLHRFVVEDIPSPAILIPVDRIMSVSEVTKLKYTKNKPATQVPCTYISVPYEEKIPISDTSYYVTETIDEVERLLKGKKNYSLGNDDLKGF